MKRHQSGFLESKSGLMSGSINKKNCIGNFSKIVDACAESLKT